jgi:hypothetical protein
VKFVFMTKKVVSGGPNNDSINSAGSGGMASSSIDEFTSPAPAGRRASSSTYTPPPGVMSPAIAGTINDRPVEGPIQGLRQGVLAAIEHTSELPRVFASLLNKISSAHASRYGVVNAVHVLISRADTPTTLANKGAYTDDEMSGSLSEFLKTQLEALKAKGIRRVTFFVGHPPAAPGALAFSHPSTIAGQQTANKQGHSIFTFRHSSSFEEDRLFRHIEAPHAFHLELPRLANFAVSLDNNPATSGNVFLYRAVPKDNATQTR